MENILGHTKDLTLYGSCGNVMYTFVNLKYQIIETFYDAQGEAVKQKTKDKK